MFIKESIIVFNLQKDFVYYLRINFNLNFDFIEWDFLALELLTIMKCFNQIKRFKLVIDFKKVKYLVANRTGLEVQLKVVLTWKEKEQHLGFTRKDHQLVVILRFVVQKFPMTFYLN
jgi:hypothetical protein